VDPQFREGINKLTTDSSNSSAIRELARSAIVLDALIVAVPLSAATINSGTALSGRCTMLLACAIGMRILCYCYRVEMLISISRHVKSQICRRRSNAASLRTDDRFGRSRDRSHRNYGCSLIYSMRSTFVIKERFRFHLGWETVNGRRNRYSSVYRKVDSTKMESLSQKYTQ